MADIVFDAGGKEFMNVKLTDLFAAELERETPATRKVLERVPQGKNDWKPHAKSMPLGYLSSLVARMPSWIAMMIQQNELDLNPPGGNPYRPKPPQTAQELVQVLEESLKAGREALASTTDDHLATTWRLLVAGRVVDERARHLMIRDTINHWAHHRGQLTVYLRLNEAPVPSIYGPSADEVVF
jgi:uncharacterized damage-inducible protein DinB